MRLWQILSGGWAGSSTRICLELYEGMGIQNENMVEDEAVASAVSSDSNPKVRGSLLSLSVFRLFPAQDPTLIEQAEQFNEL